MVPRTDHVSVRLLSHQTTESHDRSDAGEEQEDGRRQALRVKPVDDVRQIELGTVFDVIDQSAEQPVNRYNGEMCDSIAFI